MKFRRPKSILTDYRPPGAGAPSPLERECKPQPGAAAWPKPSFDRERAVHDKQVAMLSDAALLAEAKDLGVRHAYNRRDPESRWICGRLAALAREIDRRGLNRTSNAEHSTSNTEGR